LLSPSSEVMNGIQCNAPKPPTRARQPATGNPTRNARTCRNGLSAIWSGTLPARPGNRRTAATRVMSGELPGNSHMSSPVSATAARWNRGDWSTERLQSSRTDACTGANAPPMWHCRCAPRLHKCHRDKRTAHEVRCQEEAISQSSRFVRLTAACSPVSLK
jgi:hypothetical protein